jgi:hypothetical protein
VVALRAISRSGEIDPVEAMMMAGSSSYGTRNPPRRGRVQLHRARHHPHAPDRLAFGVGPLGGAHRAVEGAHERAEVVAVGQRDRRLGQAPGRVVVPLQFAGHVLARGVRQQVGAFVDGQRLGPQAVGVLARAWTVGDTVGAVTHALLEPGVVARRQFGQAGAPEALLVVVTGAFDGGALEFLQELIERVPL